MSSIIAKADLSTHEWAFDYAELAPGELQLFLGFETHQGACCFDCLQFGYSIVDGVNVASQNSWPPDGVTYVDSDQEYLASATVRLQSQHEYVLKVFASNSECEFEKNFTFMLPKPKQPHPSWLWSGAGWQAPIEYPTDDADYLWDETIGNWVPFTNKSA